MAASDGLGPGPTPTTATTAGSTGSQAAPATLLAYTGHGGFDAGYTKLASATGNDLVQQAAWPEDLEDHRCVLLSAPTIAFGQTHADELAAYMEAGGVVLALAETPSFDGGASAVARASSSLATGTRTCSNTVIVPVRLRPHVAGPAIRGKRPYA
jgi:hypothetical protein